MEPESQVWSGGYSAKAMIGSWLLAIILSIGLAAAGFYQGTQEVWIGAAVAILLIWMVLGLLFLYRRLSLQYTLTNQKFIHSAGILRRTTDRIELIDVDDVSFEQGIVQRMLGVGSIKISSSDKSHPQMVLIGIDKVQEIAAKLDDLRRRERRKHAVHIESV